MKIAVLQTARAGSESVINKNQILSDEIPLFLHNIRNASQSKYSLPIYLSTNMKNVREHLDIYNANLIERPEELCSSDASHHEVIKHGLHFIEQQLNAKVELLVVLLGNTISAWPEDIDKAIDILKHDQKIDSVITVGKYNMYNPLRSLYLDSGGLLQNFINQSKIDRINPQKATNDKDIVNDVYYLNGSLMVMRREAILSTNNVLPFPWLGKRVHPIVQNSTFMEIDAAWQVPLLDIMLEVRNSDDN